MVRHLTVSAVDDDEAVRDSLRALLESHEMSVRDYSSAMEFLADTDGHGTEPDCIILDLHMPSLSGIELLEILRRRRVPTPVIILTGRGDADLRARAQRLGAVAVLDKPVADDVLVSAIESAVSTPPSR
jgi:FixJ family two-component response regulator